MANVGAETSHLAVSSLVTVAGSYSVRSCAIPGTLYTSASPAVAAIGVAGDVAGPTRRPDDPDGRPVGQLSAWTLINAWLRGSATTMGRSDQGRICWINVTPLENGFRIQFAVRAGDYRRNR